MLKYHEIDQIIQLRINGVMTARGIAPNYRSNGNSPTALWKGANMCMLQEPLSIMGSCPDGLWQIDEVNKL
nr:hypothetical protein [uncultured Flavobacterium sp.]